MKVAPIVAKALSKRGIILRHAPILINEKLVVPSQDKNDLITYSASGRKLIVVKYGFTDEEEGNCAFLILHIENVERVIDLCDEIDTVAKKYETWRNALKGEALHLFETAVVAAQGNAANVRQADINAGIEALKKRVFPANAAKWEKKHLTHCVYKPADMRISQFKDELWAINRKIAKFPPTERRLADGTVQSIAATSMPEDQLYEIFEAALPSAWEPELLKHNVNTVTVSIEEMVSFCERLEIHEDIHGARAQKKAQKDAKPSGDYKPASRSNKKRKADDGEWKKSSHNCVHHGPNSTHSTDECKVVKAMVESAKGNRKSYNSFKKKSYDKKEANAIGKAAVKEFIKSAKKAGSQRKAREPEGYQMESSSLDELEQYAADLGLTESDDESNSSSDDESTNDRA